MCSWERPGPHQLNKQHLYWCTLPIVYYKSHWHGHKQRKMIFYGVASPSIMNVDKCSHNNQVRWSASKKFSVIYRKEFMLTRIFYKPSAIRMAQGQYLVWPGSPQPPCFPYHLASYAYHPTTLLSTAWGVFDGYFLIPVPTLTQMGRAQLKEFPLVALCMHKKKNSFASCSCNELVKHMATASGLSMCSATFCFANVARSLKTPVQLCTLLTLM